MDGFNATFLKNIRELISAEKDYRQSGSEVDLLKARNLEYIVALQCNQQEFRLSNVKTVVSTQG